MKLSKFGCISLVLIASLSSLNSQVLAGLNFSVFAGHESQSNEIGPVEIFRRKTIVTGNRLLVEIPEHIETIELLLKRLAVSEGEERLKRLAELTCRFTRLKHSYEDMASLSFNNLGYLVDDLDSLASQVKLLGSQCATKLTSSFTD